MFDQHFFGVQQPEFLGLGNNSALSSQSSALSPLPSLVFKKNTPILFNIEFSRAAELHTFPEGKVFQEDTAIKRLKWGTASLIVRAPITPIVLPIVHHGFEGVMPENFWFGRRPPVPLFNKNIKIIIGEPVEFDFTELRRLAMAMSGDSSFREGGGSGKGCTGGGGGGSSSSAHGLDEAAQRCLYTIISERIRSVMERLRTYGKTLRKP